MKVWTKLLLLVAAGVMAGGGVLWVPPLAPVHPAAFFPGLLFSTACVLGSVALAAAGKKPALMMVGDEQMFAELLASTLTRELGLRMNGRADTTQAALALATQSRSDLVLLDIEMAGGKGLDLIAPLRQKLPRVKIIILSSHSDPYTVYRVLQSDVQGYMEKNNPLCVLLEAVRRVLNGQSFFSPNFAAVKAQYLDSAEAFYKILSDCEQEIMWLMASGLSDAAIARHRDISEQTVSAHRKNMRMKLAAHSDRELLAYARRWGLGPQGPASPPLAMQFATL